MKEIKLSGGAVSAPVKLGDTVRRNAGPWTPTIHALLDYLTERGLREAPRPLGMDERGREILTYMPGTAAHRPWPEVLKDADGLVQMTQWLRRYHDMVADFEPPAEARWRIGKAGKAPGQIIRHGDLGPWNTLWEEGQLVGVLDWDFAEPGERITDVAQLAWYFAPLRGEKGWHEAGFEVRPDFRDRLTVMVQGYGDFTVPEVLSEVDRLQQTDMLTTQRLGGAGVHPWNLFYERGGMGVLRDENAWLQTVR
ncbi:MAG TPA: aminoglycoside phosphotransferase family protein [Candidatus Saccharimonadia bacterium]|nr:aminoglycoside phosphotransferase family protein [Candidatus Saccharimonadia bacterium]